MKSWVQSLINACFNVSCTNAIYKHRHHDEYANMCIMFKMVSKKFVGNFFLRNKKQIFFLTTCCDKNVICDYTIQKKGGGGYMMMGHVIPCHINLGPHISMS